MGKIISSSAATGTGINFFGGKVASDDSWLESLPADVNRSGSRHSGRTTDGVWVSAGASYGAQVEFKSFDAANAFIAEFHSVSRPAQGTARPRVVCDTKATFVSAYLAAAGKVEAKAPVQTVTSSLIDAELAAAMVEVEEEEAVPVSRKDEVTGQLKAMGKSPEFIAKVLAKMGL